MSLPTPAWSTTPAGIALLAALDAGADATRLVGGAVRDGLLGLACHDVDLATRFSPVDVVARLEAAGLKAVPTGLAHGTVTAVAPGLTAEVTTLRRDVSTDGRHAMVLFTDDWRADAGRRDFTINALYAALPGGTISDFFGGEADLAARRVRFIGDPLQRIAEDHLRILRFFRFSARYADAVDAAGLSACTARARDLMALSRERIAAELRGLLRVADPLPVLGLMLDRAILAPVLPEITSDRLPALARTVAAEGAAAQAPAWQRRLAALLPPDAALADTVAARLRLSNADRTRLRLAVVPDIGPDPRAMAWSIGPSGNEAVADRLIIAGEPAAATAVLAWPRPRLPVSGRDVVARGINAGPAVARCLVAFEAAWMAAGFPEDAATAAILLDRAVSAARA